MKLSPRIPMGVMGFRRSWWFWTLPFLAIGMLFTSYLHAEVVKIDREEVIQRSGFIFVGEVLEKESRWNDRGNLIVTDYRFRIDDVLYGESKQEIVLTFAGGQLPEEGQEVSDVPTFEVEDIVLLMVEETDTPQFSPVTGMFQGKFSAAELEGREQPVALDGENRLVTSEGGNAIEFDSFVEMVRREIPLAKAKPLPERKVPQELLHLVMEDLPSQVYSDSDIESRRAPMEFRLPARGPLSADLPPPPEGGDEDIVASGGSSADFGLIDPKWSYEHRAKNVPIVFNPLPSGGLLGDHDQYQMAYWNDYADIYRVMTSTGTWAWRNDRYDIAGFVDNATMIAQFGEGWGATTLAVCWKRWDGTGFSIEADIAMNPAYSWTTNDYSTYNNSGLYNADRTLLHEIGHSWGLSHQWYALSVMNYAPKKYRAYTVLYLDDVAAVRAAFPSEAVGRTDLGVSLFYANGYRNYDDSNLNRTTVVRGGSFTVSDFILENAGTTTVSTPEVRWYLVPTINSWSGSIFIGTTTHSSLSSNSYFQTSRTLTVPISVAPGAYNLGARITMASDSLSDNNSTWLDRRITITAPDLRVISPSVSKTSLLTGETFTASATVNNQGTGSSAATTLRYYASTNSTISGADTQIGTDPVVALGAGGNSAESQLVNAPSSPGTYWVGACVDAVSGESSTSNQCSTGVQIQVAPRPDLRVISPAVSQASLETGDNFIASATVNNQGTGSSAATALRYYVSTNSIISGADFQIGTDSVSVLAAGGSSAESQLVSAPSNPGTYWVGACVDAVTGESNTANQCSTGIQITVVARLPDTTGVFRPSNGLIYLKSSNTTGFADAALVFGLPGDRPVTGDWDGDGVDSIGIYRDGVFYLRNSNTTGLADITFAFGQSGDLPVAGDWNGNGVDTVGIYRDGQFLLRNSNSSGSPDIIFALGNPGDEPIAGDWDGDGDDSTGVFRPTNGLIYLKNENTTGFADIEIVFGIPNDKPAAGDWDADGTDTIGVYRAGLFLLRNTNTTGFADAQFALGVSGDVPICGKWGSLP